MIFDSKRQDSVIASDVCIFGVANFIFPPKAISERIESHSELQCTRDRVKSREFFKNRSVPVAK